eukprot:PhM_4_TR15082/c0_g1_i1/m.6578
MYHHCHSLELPPHLHPASVATRRDLFHKELGQLKDRFDSQWSHVAPTSTTNVGDAVDTTQTPHSPGESFSDHRQMQINIEKTPPPPRSTSTSTFLLSSYNLQSDGDPKKASQHLPLRSNNMTLYSSPGASSSLCETESSPSGYFATPARFLHRDPARCSVAASGPASTIEKMSPSPIRPSQSPQSPFFFLGGDRLQLMSPPQEASKSSNNNNNGHGGFHSPSPSSCARHGVVVSPSMPKTSAARSLSPQLVFFKNKTSQPRKDSSQSSNNNNNNNNNN